MTTSVLLECPECGKLAVSSFSFQHSHDGRTVALVPRTRPLEPEPVELLEEEVARIEPWLRKTQWAPMTYMLIPSVLCSAEVLAHRLAACAGADRFRARALRNRLLALRGGFHRER